MISASGQQESLAKIIEMLAELLGYIKQSEILPQILAAAYWRGFVEGALAGGVCAVIAIAVFLHWRKQQ
ncbi:MAG: hypothetical protein QW793_04825 [Candidatus Caldarchaeum sp.]